MLPVSLIVWLYGCPTVQFGSVAVVMLDADATVATCTELPEPVPSTVTLACKGVPGVRLPSPVRLTVNVKPVALVTVPVTPLSKVTMSLAVVVSKPEPAIVILAALAGKLAVFATTVGGAW